MEELNIECLPLSKVNPLSYAFKVMVKFDRPFKRDWMRSFGPNKNPFKELVSLDVVLYDQEVWYPINSWHVFGVTFQIQTCFWVYVL